MSYKRPRSINFTQSEKEILIELVAQYKDVVENKKLDTLSVREKEKVWVEIQENFNALSENYRTVISLKNCWDNIKRRCRKNNIESEHSENLLNSSTDRDSSDMTEELLISKVGRILDVSLSDIHLPLTDSPVIHSIQRKNESIQRQPLLHKSTQDTLNDMLEEKRQPLYKRSAQDPVNTLLEEKQQPLYKRSAQDTVNNKWEEKRQTPSKRSAQDAFFEEKTKFLKLGIEHAIKEEKRKSEIHALQVEEKTLQIELLKLQILKEREKE